MMAGTSDGDLWVFGYGSLLWSPCFTPVEQRLARLSGYHRSFCMWSIHHRGTPDAPGLVLALDKAADAYCDGIAFRVAASDRDQALADLRERELVSSAYLEVWLSLTLDDGRIVEAVVYVIDPEHVQYAAGLSLKRQARIIADAVGDRGPNPEYLMNTHDHLVELGIEDPDLAWLASNLPPKQAV